MDSAAAAWPTSARSGQGRPVLSVQSRLNVVATAFWATMTLIGGLMTCGIGCLLIFLPSGHLTVLIFDFIAVSRFSAPPTPGTLSFLKMVAILDLLAGLAVVPLVLGILNLVLLAKPEVYAHFYRAERV